MSLTGILLKGFGPTASGTAPTAPTLAVADDEDGTGATATITGADAGTTNTVYTSAAGTSSSLSFTSAGSRSGDGTVEMSLAEGMYWAYVTSDDGSGCTSQSNMVLFRVSSGAEAVYYQCLTAIQTTIRTLSLTGIASADIRVQKLPWRARQVSPGIFITPTTESLNPKDGTNIYDNIGYAVQVVLIQDSNRSQTTNLDRLLDWRETVRHAFINQRLTGVTEVMWCTVEMGAVVLPTAFEANYDVQSLVIRCRSREARGI